MSGESEQTVKFRIGPPTRPEIKHDNGFLDKYPKRNPTTDDVRKFAEWKLKMGAGLSANGLMEVLSFGGEYLRDGLLAYQHFLDASGTDRFFDYDRFLEHDRSGRLVSVYTRLLARQGAEQIYRGQYESQIRNGGISTFMMSGGVIGVGAKDARFPNPESENWQKAIGAHFIWISANVIVQVIKNGMPTFTMISEVHAEDRYNFNPGQKDIATGTPDSANGLFEITGLAKQYTQYGVSRRMERWIGKTADIMQIMYNVPGPW